MTNISPTGSALPEDTGSLRTWIQVRVDEAKKNNEEPASASGNIDIEFVETYPNILITAPLLIVDPSFSEWEIEIRRADGKDERITQQATQQN